MKKQIEICVCDLCGAVMPNTVHGKRASLEVEGRKLNVTTTLSIGISLPHGGTVDADICQPCFLQHIFDKTIRGGKHIPAESFL